MRVISPLAFLLITWSLATPVLAQRLAHGATPEHYDLVITPDLTQATFRGDETIRSDSVARRANAGCGDLYRESSGQS
jgi:hypothetical protein